MVQVMLKVPVQISANSNLPIQISDGAKKDPSLRHAAGSVDNSDLEEPSGSVEGIT